MSYDPVQWQLDRQAEAALHTREFHKHHPEYLTPKEDRPMSQPIPKEIRATVPAWFASSFSGPDDLRRKPDEAVTSVTFCTSDMTQCGWSRAGEAEIILRPLGEQQLVESKVESLRAQKTKVLAEAQAEATEIEGQIQQLLAISYDAPAEVVL